MILKAWREFVERFNKSDCSYCGAKSKGHYMCNECLYKMYKPDNWSFPYSDDESIKVGVVVRCSECRIKFKGPGVLCEGCRYQLGADKFGRFYSPKECVKCSKYIVDIYEDRTLRDGLCPDCSDVSNSLNCNECNRPFSPYVYNDYSRGLCFECIHDYKEWKEDGKMRVCDVLNDLESGICKNCWSTLHENPKQTCESCGRLVKNGNVCTICWESTVVKGLPKKYSDSEGISKKQYRHPFYKDPMDKSKAVGKSVVDGVGKDAPTVINELGGKQSKVLYRYDLLDPKSMFEMTKVLSEGAEKYGEDNWRKIPIEDHLNHMIIHAYAYLAGDKSDEHLSHIMCRAMFAQAVEIQEKEEEEK